MEDVTLNQPFEMDFDTVQLQNHGCFCIPHSQMNGQNCFFNYKALSHISNNMYWL